MNKLFKSIIIGFISSIGIISIYDLSNYKLAAIILFIAMNIIFDLIIYLNINKFNNKKNNIYSLVISIILLYSFVLGNNLTLYNVSYIEKISTHLKVLMSLPIVMTFFVYIFNNFTLIKTKLDKFNIKKIDDFLFSNNCFFKCFILIIIAWLPIFLAFYPGIFSYDSSTQLEEFLTMHFTNSNPIIHTFIVGSSVYLGKIIFNSYGAGIAIYTLMQLIISGLVFAYIISFLNKKKCPFYLKFITLILFMFLPTHSIMVLVTTKDIYFSLIIALMFIKLIDLVTNPNNFFNKKWNSISLIILSYLCFLFRHNGYYAFIFLSIFLLIYLKKYFKNILIIILICIIPYKIYVNIINNILNNSNSALSSALLCVPAQQLGNVYKNGNIDNSTKQKLDQLLKGKNSFIQYEARKSDSILFHINNKYLNDNLNEYKKLYIKLGKKYPVLYIDAFLNNTMGYWYIMDSLPDGCTYRKYIEIKCVYDRSSTNNQIKFNSKIKWLYNIYYSLIKEGNYKHIPGLNIIMSIGFNVLLFLFLCLIIIYKKEYYKLVPCSLIIGLLITVIIGPVAILRYVYYLFIIMPIMFYLVFYNKKDN